MPAKSKSQQRFMGMVHSYNKGDMKDAPKSVKKVAKSMTKKAAKDFASTTHKGKPEHVKENTSVKITRNEIKDMVREVMSNSDMKKEADKLDKLAKERTMAMLTKKDKETLRKIADLMRRQVKKESVNEEILKEDIPELKKIVKELEGASKMHAGQAKRIQAHLDSMNVEEESLDENILRQIQQAEKIAKSMGGDMTGAIKGIEKIRRGLSHHKRVKIALKKANESINETPEELGGMKMYSKADALKKVNSMQKTAGAKIYKVEKVKAKLYGKPATMYNLYTKNKNHSTNQNPYGLPMMKGVYIVPVQEALNVMPGRSGINADEHEIKDFLLKAMKMSGIKVLKFNPMKKGFIGNDVWGGFYTVKSNHKGQMGATQKSDVLPLYIQRSGKINLGVASKEFIIGKIGDLSKVVKNLKDFKKTDLDL